MSEALVSPSVAESLAKLTLSETDQAAAQLARVYAAAIDDAFEVAEQAKLVEPRGEDDSRVLQGLLRRVEAQAVLGELGPKLLAVLESLGASPRARAALRARGGGQGDGSSARSKLDELRERRVRKHGSSSVDASSS